MENLSTLEYLQQQILFRAEQIEAGKIDIVNPDDDEATQTLETVEGKNGSLQFVFTIGGPYIYAEALNRDLFKVTGYLGGLWWEVVGRSEEFCKAALELEFNR